MNRILWLNPEFDKCFRCWQSKEGLGEKRIFITCDDFCWTFLCKMIKKNEMKENHFPNNGFFKGDLQVTDFPEKQRKAVCKFVLFLVLDTPKWNLNVCSLFEWYTYGRGLKTYLNSPPPFFCPLFFLHPVEHNASITLWKYSSVYIPACDHCMWSSQSAINPLTPKTRLLLNSPPGCYTLLYKLATKIWC